MMRIEKQVLRIRTKFFEAVLKQVSNHITHDADINESELAQRWIETLIFIVLTFSDFPCQDMVCDIICDMF